LSELSPFYEPVIENGLDYVKYNSIQQYVIEFVSDLQKVSGSLWVHWFPPPIKLTTMI
jgi:hypothetical protein